MGVPISKKDINHDAATIYQPKKDFLDGTVAFKRLP
jgi:hypothetical protein